MLCACKCNTSAICQPKMLAVSRILAIFYTYCDYSAMPNISRNFFPAIRNFEKIRLGGLLSIEDKLKYIQVDQIASKKLELLTRNVHAAKKKTENTAVETTTMFQLFSYINIWTNCRLHDLSKTKSIAFLWLNKHLHLHLVTTASCYLLNGHVSKKWHIQHFT